MKKLFLFTLLVAVTTAPGLFTALATQQPTETVQNDNFNDLKLSIATLKGGFLPLEPIPIVVTISNPTDHIVVGHTAIGLSSGFIEVYVAKEKDEPRKILVLSPGLGQPLVRSREIEPDEAETLPQLLTMHLDKVFPEPGMYHVEALFYDAAYRQSVRSNKIKIHILQPSGKNARALNFIRNKEYGQSFFSGEGYAADENFVQDLEQFAAEFGDTPYADYAVYLLGEHYCTVNDNEKARKHLLKLERKGDFVYKDKVADYLAKSRDGLDRSN